MAYSNPYAAAAAAQNARQRVYNPHEPTRPKPAARRVYNPHEPPKPAARRVYNPHEPAPPQPKPVAKPVFNPHEPTPPAQPVYNPHEVDKARREAEAAARKAEAERRQREAAERQRAEAERRHREEAQRKADEAQRRANEARQRADDERRAAEAAARAEEARRQAEAKAAEEARQRADAAAKAEAERQRLIAAAEAEHRAAAAAEAQRTKAAADRAAAEAAAADAKRERQRADKAAAEARAAARPEVPSATVEPPVVLPAPVVTVVDIPIVEPPKPAGKAVAKAEPTETSTTRTRRLSSGERRAIHRYMAQFVQFEGQSAAEIEEWFYTLDPGTQEEIARDVGKWTLKQLRREPAWASWIARAAAVYFGVALAEEAVEVLTEPPAGTAPADGAGSTNTSETRVSYPGSGGNSAGGNTSSKPANGPGGTDWSVELPGGVTVGSGGSDDSGNDNGNEPKPRAEEKKPLSPLLIIIGAALLAG